MLLRENATEEKLNGRYYTQFELANYVTEWVMNDNLEIRHILEPSCGDGVFLQCLGERKLQENCEILAIEIDENESILANNRINESIRFNNYDEFAQYRINNINQGINLEAGCKVINDDFYKVYEESLNEQRFQAIVGNPPYIRYQYLSETQRKEQSFIIESNGMRANKLINSWVSFVVACVQMMDVNSRIGLVIPAELLQVKYAEDLRRFLMRNLQRTTIVTFEELVFEGVEQEVILLLGEKDNSHEQEHQLRIVQYRNVAQLINDNDLDKHEFFNVDLNESKWTKYFLKDRHIHLINNIRIDDRFLQFKDVARIEVGITTGNNDYFCVNRNQVEEYNLENVCRPLIARSVNINGIKFTMDDWHENIEKGTKTYLIDFPDIPYEEYDEGHRKYIEYGEESNQNTGYKCRIRERWYRVPSIRVSDAFFLRRNYLYPKFVLNSNEVNAVSTDTMHRVTFNNEMEKKRILLSYYNSVGLAFTEIEGRSYGGGVLEILPGEVGKIILPDLRDRELVSDTVVDELIDIIDKYCRKNSDILGILDEIDNRVLVDIIGMNMNDVIEFRNMWLTLRTRRLGRGKNS